MNKKKRKRIIIIIVISIVLLALFTIWLLWPTIKSPLNSCDWPINN